MEALLEKAKQVLSDETYNAGWTIAPQVSEDSSKTPNFSAKTNLETKEHIYSYNPAYSAENGEEKFTRTLKDLPKHEIDHHGYKGCVGCPQNVDKNHDLFFLPAYEVLSKKGFSKTDTDYLTNSLQDTILHRDLSVNGHFSLEGIVNFFEDIGNIDKSKKYTEFYEAHTKLNMYLWGNKQQKKRLKGFYKHDKKVTEVLKNFIFETSKLDFLDESNWKQITEVYAREFSKLMTPGYAMPTFNHSGTGTKGKPSETKGSEESEESNSDEEGNVFQKEMRTKSFKKGKVMEANSKGEAQPIWIDSFEAKDIVYEGLAQKLVIKAESYTNPQSMPIVWFRKRAFNERDNLKHTEFGFGDNGQVELKKKSHSIDMPISVKSCPKSFPELKFGLMDVSSSMLADLNDGSNTGNKSIIPWGDNSKYHWGVMVEYGIWEYLRQNHLLSQNNISGAFFGENTVVINGLNELKKKLLNPTFEDSTSIDINAINSFFKGRGNLLYTISDGQIQNWSEIRKDYMNLAKNHCYIHLHMGVPNPMTKDLEKNKLNVIYGKDGKGITEKVIDLTDKIFRSDA